MKINLTEPFYQIKKGGRNLAGKIKHNYKVYRIEKRQNEINRLVEISDNGINPQALNKIREAQTTLANYARNEGVWINISDKAPVSKNIEKASLNHIQENTGSDLYVSVTDMLKNNSAAEAVSGDVDRTYKFSTKNAKSEMHFEDNFLRNLYRHIGNLVNSLQR